MQPDPQESRTRPLKSIEFLKDQEAHTRGRQEKTGFRIVMAMASLGIFVTVFDPLIGIPMLLFCALFYTKTRKK